MIAAELLNAFSVDVEDYFHVSAFEKVVDRSRWGSYESRVVSNTHRILALLERHQVRATFFVLGWVAETYPQLVREIHDGGHEIGSHGRWHRLIYEQSPAEFRADVRESKSILENTIGAPVTAHRAASFSITRRSLWALEILAEEGFAVDTSIVPVVHDRYGIPDAIPTLHRIATAAGPLWEFPPPVLRFAGLKLPVGGGGYFRLLPLPLTLRWLARVNRDVRAPFVFYVHPWEIDPDQPRLPVRSPLARFRHYVNLASTERKLDVLLRHFRFGRICDVIPQE